MLISLRPEGDSYIILPFRCGYIIHPPAGYGNLATTIWECEHNIKKYVTFEKGVAKVDWEKVAAMSPAENEQAVDYHIGLINYLQELGILSAEPSGNFTVEIPPNINASPSRFYFTRELDAKEFAKIFQKHSVEELIVRHCES